MRTQCCGRAWCSDDQSFIIFCFCSFQSVSWIEVLEWSSECVECLQKFRFLCNSAILSLCRNSRCQWLHMSVYTLLPIYLPTYLSIYISTYPYTYLPAYLPTYLPIYLHIYLSNCALEALNWHARNIRYTQNLESNKIIRGWTSSGAYCIYIYIYISGFLCVNHELFIHSVCIVYQFSHPHLCPPPLPSNSTNTPHMYI